MTTPERAEFAAAVMKYGGAVADIMTAIPMGEPLPAAAVGKAALDSCLAIFDRIVGERDSARDQREFLLAEIHRLVRAIDNAAGQTTDPMCRDALQRALTPSDPAAKRVTG